MAQPKDRRRVVVTGQGVVSSVGIGVDAFWDSLKNARCGIGEATLYDTEELLHHHRRRSERLRPAHPYSPSKQFMLADRYSQFAGCAANEAVTQSGMEMPLSGDEGYRAACIVGSGIGGISTMELSYKMLFEQKKRATHPLTLLKTIASSAAAHVSIEYGITGPCFGVVSACSTAPHSIGLVYRMIREGLCDLGIGGASEASLNWGTTRAWQAMRVLSPDGLFSFSKKPERYGSG